MAEENDTQQDNTDEIQNIANGTIPATIEPDGAIDLIKTFQNIKDLATSLFRNQDQGIVNENTGASVTVRSDGQINLSASKYANFKVHPCGRTSDFSLESETIANRKKFNIDDFVINEHKLNPQLWELTDMKKQKLLINQDVTIGNLTMSGHVLVKAWEPNLKRYMLIRRPWRGPVFGPLLNTPEIHTALAIDDPLKVTETILALSEKGYQVNGVIKDAKTLIGKTGEDRSGSASRTEDAMAGQGASSGGSVSGGSGVQVTATAETKSIYKALRKLGYNDIAACGIMGNIKQESGFNPTIVNGIGATGLCQWYQTRCDRLKQKYPNDTWKDAGNQISYLFWECETSYTTCLPAKMNTFSTPEEAAKHFEEEFEGAGEGAMIEQRQSYARQFYTLYKGT